MSTFPRSIEFPSNGGRQRFVLSTQSTESDVQFFSLEFTGMFWSDNAESQGGLVSKSGAVIHEVEIHRDRLLELAHCLETWKESHKDFSLSITAESVVDSLVLGVSKDSRLLSSEEKPALFVKYSGVGLFEVAAVYLIDGTCIDESLRGLYRVLGDQPAG